MEIPKFYIKCNKDNWEENKKAVDFLRSKKFVVQKRKNSNFTDLDVFYLKSFIGNAVREREGDFYYSKLKPDSRYENLKMPEDFEKLKSYFEEVVVSKVNNISTHNLLKKEAYKTPSEAINCKLVDNYRKKYDKAKDRIKELEEEIKRNNEHLLRMRNELNKLI